MSQRLTVSPDASFNWKLLKIGSASANEIGENVPNLQVGCHAPAPPTLPVIKV